MTIGNHYRIIGIPACVQNGLQATACIEVNSVQLYKPNGKKVPLKFDFKKDPKTSQKKILRIGSVFVAQRSRL